ncbi:hypothetical protein B0E50_11715 [Rhodanobacter sp. C01]|nr:hypothetical protein B0E50_11715 [Rhodanobacter sp. C01]
MHLMKLFRASILLALLYFLAACQNAPTRPPASGRFTAAQIAELRHQGFYETPAGWEFDGSEKVLFGINAAELSPDGRKIIERIGHGLLGVGIKHAQLDGFTDNTGQPDYNLKLSRQRAQAVADGLVATGMRLQDLDIQGFGENNPVTSNRTSEGRAQNRRVAIIISSP